MTQVNSWLNQSYSVRELLSAADAALQFIPQDKQEHSNLKAKMAVFQKIVTPVEWSLDDAKGIFPGMDESSLLDGLDYFSYKYSLTDWDWSYFRDMLEISFAK